jgi:GntR family transcriptional repressor for pyruvate dehydrogenase complex
VTGGYPFLLGGARRLPPPRIGEAVAAHLREQIMGGGMEDGSELPSQERLVEEFRVSKQAIRDGLQILESEGLVTVRRGKVGGALVHLPSPGDAAYNFALVMQSRKVRLHEVGAALTELEPICVGLCAQRDDRMETVIPQLRIVDQSAANSTDLSAWLASQRRFHRLLASECGNEVISILVGALEAIWLEHVRVWAERLASMGTLTDWSALTRDGGIVDHKALIDLIERGEAQQAEALARRHMAEFFARLSDFQTTITATALANRLS